MSNAVLYALASLAIIASAGRALAMAQVRTWSVPSWYYE